MRTIPPKHIQGGICLIGTGIRRITPKFIRQSFLRSVKKAD